MALNSYPDVCQSTNEKIKAHIQLYRQSLKTESFLTEHIQKVPETFETRDFDQKIRFLKDVI